MRHFEEVARAAGGRPVILYNIPVAHGAQHAAGPARRARADRRHRGRQAGQRRRAAADRRARACSPATTTTPRPLPRHRRRRAASASPRTSSATRCAACTTSPSRRAEIDASLRDVYDVLFCTASPIPVKAALNMLGHDVGGLRLPLVEASDEERALVAGDARAPRAAQRSPHRVSGTLRVLPLGGVGEIGKNMTVVEYDGRIVVVDCGLRFPTAEMMGIDLVLPDFTYLRERVDAIEAIVITHGHEDHLGALPWVLRELGQDERPGRLRRPADGRDGALQARRAQAARGQPRGAPDRPTGAGRARSRSSASTSRTRSPTPAASRSRLPARDRALHRRLQVRPDAGRRRARRHGAAGRDGPRGPAAAVRRLHERRPPGRLRQRVDRRPAPRARLPPLQGPDRRHLLRLEHPPRAAGRRRRGRRTAARSRWSGRSMRKNVNIGRSLGHIDVPEGMLVQPREVDQFPDEKLVIISTGSQGEPLSRAAPDGLPRPPAGRAQARATRSSSPPRRSRATSARSTRRSTGSTTSAATS